MVQRNLANVEHEGELQTHQYSIFEVFLGERNLKKQFIPKRVYWLRLFRTLAIFHPSKTLVH